MTTSGIQQTRLWHHSSRYVMMHSLRQMRMGAQAHRPEAAVRVG